MWLEQGSEVCELGWMSSHAWRRVEQRKMGKLGTTNVDASGQMFTDLKP